MKTIYLLFGLIICSCSVAQENNLIKNNLISTVVEIVQENHISPKVLDNNLSKVIFEEYISTLDENKDIFTQDHINTLLTYQEGIAQDLKKGSTYFFDASNKVFSDALLVSEKHYNYSIKHITKSSVNIEEVTNTFSKSTATLKTDWQNKLNIKYTLEIEKAKSSPKVLNKKSHALTQTKYFYETYFKGLKAKTREQKLNNYINCYVQANDYQSHFMSTKEKTAWDNDYNRNYVGVGLSIEIENNYPVIKSITENGPAWKTQKLNEGDIIKDISNSLDEYISTEGLRLKEIIKLLKGEEGTIVSLKVEYQKRLKEISITREKLMLSRVFSAIVQDKSTNHKMGYIQLPRFYIGDTSSADDILEEINYFKKNKISDIIFDLRNNKGGSATQAISIIGYFLKGEAVMKIKHNDESNIRTRIDPDSLAQFEGNIVVLVNDKSGSASELMSGTLQDYNRAIIVGNQTFGKGTMQRFFSVDEEVSQEHHGDLKLTIASFYTGDGHSTQYYGVTPDIIFPSDLSPEDTGERAIKSSLKFEDLESNQNISKYISDNLKTEVQSKYENRLQYPLLNNPAKKLNLINDRLNKDKLIFWEDKMNTDSNLIESFNILQDLIKA